MPLKEIVAWIVGIVGAGLVGIAGFSVQRGMDQLDRLTERVSAVELSNAATNATRDDILRRLERMDSKLDRIENATKYR